MIWTEGTESRLAVNQNREEGNDHIPGTSNLLKKWVFYPNSDGKPIAMLNKWVKLSV